MNRAATPVPVLHRGHPIEIATPAKTPVSQLSLPAALGATALLSCLFIVAPAVALVLVALVIGRWTA